MFNHIGPGPVYQGATNPSFHPPPLYSGIPLVPPHVQPVKSGLNVAKNNAEFSKLIFSCAVTKENNSKLDESKIEKTKLETNKPSLKIDDTHKNIINPEIPSSKPLFNGVNDQSMPTETNPFKTIIENLLKPMSEVALQETSKIDDKIESKKENEKVSKIELPSTKIEESNSKEAPSSSKVSYDEKFAPKIGKVLVGRISYSVEELFKARSFLLSTIKPDAYTIKDSSREPYWVESSARDSRNRLSHRRSENAWISTKERLARYFGDESKFEIFKIKLQSSVNKLAASNFNSILAEINLLLLESDKHIEFLVNCVLKSIFLNHAWILNFAKVLISIYNTQLNKNPTVAHSYKKFLIQTLKDHTVITDVWIKTHKEMKDSLEILSEDDADIRSEEILIIEDRKRKEVIGCTQMLAHFFKMSFIDSSEIGSFMRSFFKLRHELEFEILCSFASMTCLLPQSKKEPVYEELFTILVQQMESRPYRIRFIIKDLLDLRESMKITVETISYTNKPNDEKFALVPQRRPKNSNPDSADDNNKRYTPKGSNYSTNNSHKPDNDTSMSSRLSKVKDYGLNNNSGKPQSQRGSAHIKTTDHNAKSLLSNRYASLASDTDERSSINHDRKEPKKPYYAPTKAAEKTIIPPITLNKKYDDVNKLIENQADDKSYSSTDTSAEVKDLLLPLLNDYMKTFNIEEISARLKLCEFSYHMPFFVKNAFAHYVEKLSFEHEYFGCLIYKLYHESRITMSEFSQGFEQFLPAVYDLEIDFPMIWNFISRSIGILVCSSLFTLTNYYTILLKNKIDQPEKHIYTLLNELLSSTSKLTVQSVWSKFNRSFKEFFKGIIDEECMSKFDFINDVELHKKYLFSFDTIINTIDSSSTIKDLNNQLYLISSSSNYYDVNMTELAKLLHYCCPPGSTSAIHDYMESTIPILNEIFKFSFSSKSNISKFFSNFVEPMKLVNNKPTSFLKMFSSTLVKYDIITKQDIQSIEHLDTVDDMTEILKDIKLVLLA